jgi:hypothetical protein
MADDAQDPTRQRERDVVGEQAVTVGKRHVFELDRERAGQLVASAVDDRRLPVRTARPRVAPAPACCNVRNWSAITSSDPHELDRLEQEEHGADRDLTGS